MLKFSHLLILIPTGRYLVYLTYHIVLLLHDFQAETVQKSRRQPKDVEFLEVKGITIKDESG